MGRFMLTTVAVLVVVASAAVAQNTRSGSAYPDVTNVIEQIRPSVVQIEVRLRYSFVNSSMPVNKVIPVGSGFVADTYGHVITAKHVVTAIESIPAQLMNSAPGSEGPIDRSSITTEIYVGFATTSMVNKNIHILGNFQVIRATVQKKGTTDIAILQLDQNPFTALRNKFIGQIGNSNVGAAIQPAVPRFATDAASEGDAIAVSGYPLSVPSLVTTVGWLASKWMEDNGEFVQVGSVQSNPGNSGGPVYRVRDGVIIGIAKGVLLAPVIMRINGIEIHNEQEGVNSGLAEITPIKEALELLGH